MPRLIERTVQNIAQKRLEEYYEWKAKSPLFSQIEVRTKKEHGSKRADGFLAFKHRFWGTFVVSLEAKSFKTLDAIKPYYDRQLHLKNSLIAGFVLSVLLACLVPYFEMEPLRALIPLFLTTTLGYGFFSKKSFRHQRVDVIDQLQQYPANDQWLAFSFDSVNDLKYNEVKKLRALCRNKGYGLLIVKSKKEVDLITRPRTQWRMRGNYLEFYANEKKMREKIGIVKKNKSSRKKINWSNWLFGKGRK